MECYQVDGGGAVLQGYQISGRSLTDLHPVGAGVMFG